jgi:8-amino-7-oxononanoate synthase
LDGTSPHHSALENRLARFFAYRTDSGRVDQTAALLFNSGYDANVSFFSTIPQKGDYIVHDELVHASVWDGMRANERRGVPQQDRFSFRHNSVKHLELTLREIVKRENTRCGTGMIYVGIESLYSMDGDVPPLKAIIALLNKLGRDHPRVINKERIHIILDEAHTTGIWGPKGRGLACSVQEDQWDTETLETDNIVKVEDWVKVRIMTFGKGVGGQGCE